MNGEHNSNSTLGAKQDVMTTVPEGATAKPRKRNIQLTGLLMLLGGIFLLIINWRSVLADGTYWIYASFLAPMAMCWGVSMLLTKNKKLPDGTTEAAVMNQKGFVALGVILGVINWLLISGLVPLLGF